MTQPPERVRQPARSAWWIGIGAGVAGGLVVLLFTGLVAPGFLLSEDESQPRERQPAANIGGGTTKTNLVLDRNPYETVRKVYQHVAQNTPELACGRFTDEGRQQFAKSFAAATCEEAIANLNAQVDKKPGSKNVYAEPDFRGKMSERPSGTSIEISSCDLGVTAGPRLGAFTANKIEFDQWIITAHRPEAC